MQITNGRLSGVRFVPATSSGAALSPSLIVVHDTAGRLDKFSSVNWFASKGCKTSAHFVVEVDGTITQMVRTDRRAFHAGQSSWNGKRFCNSFSIGIEIVNPGKLSDDGRAWFGKATSEPLTHKKTKEHGDGWWMSYPPAQILAVKKLCRALMEEYPDCNEIVTHWMISPKRKIDTNPLFPLDEVFAYAEGHDEPPVDLPSDTPVIRAPVPPSVPVPTTVPEIAKVSRKGWWGLSLYRVLKGIFASLSLTSLLEYLGMAKEVRNEVGAFFEDHGLTIGISVALVSILALRHILNLMVEDVVKGNYVPSKLADQGARPVGVGVEPAGAVPPVGQAE
jgi:N-acetylmuramoyl-L-alanine amidase